MMTDFPRYVPTYTSEVIAANKKSLEEKIQSKNVFTTTHMQTDKELIKELVEVILRIKEWDIEGFALAIPLDIRKDMQAVIEKAKGVIND